jgi:hypothetical protein
MGIGMPIAQARIPFMGEPPLLRRGVNAGVGRVVPLRVEFIICLN